jgi:subtilisin family serine protease
MKIAIVDSGINATHPYVRSVAGGIGVTSTENWTEDTTDRLGHGTAVAAVIREKAPEAELFAVKIFDRGFFPHADIMVRALNWCHYHRMDIVSLSIGADDSRQRAAFKCAVSGLIVVSPAHQLPGCLPGVIAVEADETLGRNEFRARDGVFYASPRPRLATELTAPAKDSGVDFAVANMAGIVARLLPSLQVAAGTAKNRLLKELASLAGPGAQRDALAAANLTADAWAIES